MRKISIIIFLFTVSFGSLIAQNEKNIIYLSLDEVVTQSLNENLSLKSKILDYESQNLEVLKSYSTFLPTFSYQGMFVKNVELPVFVFMGQSFTVGTPYTFQHSLSLSLPVFTGGARIFNISAQKSIKKSLAEELKGKEAETVLNGMQSYYGIILAQSFFEIASEAVKVAEQNLTQVQNQYDAGVATELDLQRAKAQYYSTLPKLESAKSSLRISKQQLKSFLNLSLEDSLVVVDSLTTKKFLKEIDNITLTELKQLGLKNKHELLALRHQLDATNQGEYLSLANFAPKIAISASVDHQAQMEDINVSWNDYIRSKSIALAVNWPIFEGGSKIIEWQKAKIRSDQMELALKQFEDQSELFIEQSYFKYHEASSNLESLQETLKQSNESLRISNLLYEQGMSTQLDVLNAQLLYINSKIDYQQGIYDYNISQLKLLQSIGKLNTIWN
ncbi:MAG: TolC family protein [Ignavibacteriales bacterium]|jgi:outer membrane protein TolC|nr:MAG: TolC family protein [Ignavibacteriales bacterium]